MRSNLVVFAILLVLAALSWQRYADTPSPDLLATWMAGKFFAAGALDQIYPPDTEFFSMHPPDQWLPVLDAEGYDGAIYPFIYPPIWAYLGAVLQDLVSFKTVTGLAGILNPLMIGAMVWLAARMAVPGRDAIPFVLISAAIFASSLVCLVALEQNQLQIFVAFLMVLAVERTRAGAPVLGGAAMALAAAVKLYPVIFALIWLVQGQRRAAASFILFGGALGLLSVALTGWPLHAEFLSQIRVISGSVMIQFFTYGVDPTIAHLFFTDQLQLIPTLRNLANGQPEHGWLVMVKPALWRLADLGLLLAVVAGLCGIARSRRGQDALFWPFAFTLVSLVLPLSWGYHFLPALVFAAALFWRGPPRQALVQLIVVFVPVSVPFFTLVLNTPELTDFMQPLGTLAMAAYALFLWIAVRKPA